MSCSYGAGASCGSRFSGYPCAPPGPPRYDANNNLIPNRKVLCGTEVCTSVGSFRDYVLVGNVTSLLNPAILDLYGDENVYGTLTISQNGSPSGVGGLVLTADATFNAACDLNLKTARCTAPTPTICGASLVMAKADSVNGGPSRGGRLDVIFFDATGATTASGFLYTSQPPSWYRAGGTGIYNEEKIASALKQAPDTVVLPQTAALLTTTVLSTQGSNIVQRLQTSSGLYVRAGNSTDSAWGLWVSYATFAAPP